MQEKELDNLVTGQPSRMAFIPDNMSAQAVNNDFVKQNEIPTPPPVVKAVDIWVARCKALGMSEKNIKKSVRSRFGIKIVKE